MGSEDKGTWQMQCCVYRKQTFLWKVIHEIRTTINSPTFRGPFVAVEGIFVDEMTKKLEKVENYSLLRYAEMHKNTQIIRISWTANPQK